MSQDLVYEHLKQHPKMSYTAKKLAEIIGVRDKTLFNNLGRLLSAKLIIREAGYDKNGRLTSHYRVRL